MLILGIESSCDETAAAVVQDGTRLFSNVIATQIDIHSQYGGVVPEVAARSHLEVVNPVINKALRDAGVTWDDIDAIAVTYAPGLSGSLLIGTIAAKTLAYLKAKPLYKIHHVEAHVYANFLTEVEDGQSELAESQESRIRSLSTEAPTMSTSSDATRADGETASKSANGEKKEAVADSANSKAVTPSTKLLSGPLSELVLPAHQPSFPMLALIVSGGHSQLVLFRNHGDYTLLGQTQDDAVGEAFDKVAKIIGLPYPGGPSVAKAAALGDDHAFTFPKAKLQGKYDFSFSGLKTAVLRTVQREVGVDFTFPSHELPGRVDDELQHNIAASFQRIAIETLVDKAKLAYDEYQPASVVIAGGVAANQELRRQLSARLPIDIEYAPVQLCTDNAAMIATLAYYRAQIEQPVDPFNLEIRPSLSMTAQENIV